MKNLYHHIRYFPQGNKFAVMDSEKREAEILSTHDSLAEAIAKRDK